MNLKALTAFMKKVKAFLETDISKREVMGKYARQKMVDEFDKKIRCKRYSKGFRLVINIDFSGVI